MGVRGGMEMRLEAVEGRSTDANLDCWNGLLNRRQIPVNSAIKGSVAKLRVSVSAV